MAKRKTKRRGSSNAGRPRKEGERYANGRLKPSGPNATVVEKRRAGDAEAGEHPLDFALSQKWITERQHRDAMAYRSIYQSAHIGGPRLSLGSLTEVPPHEALTMNWSQMTDAEITEIFDAVFGEDMPPLNPEEAHAQALKHWRLLNAHLSPAERQQLFLVSVMGSWPFWMTKAASETALGSQDRDRRDTLFGAINGVGRALRPPKRPTIQPVPYTRFRKPGVEVPVRYQDQHGQPVTPRSKDGRAFEVATVARRRSS
jgi:hypothetical protein